MKGIVSYGDKTIVQAKQNVRETESDLKSVTIKAEYCQIEETIKTNEAKTKCVLHQHQCKIFNSLKCKPETTKEETLQPTEEPTAFKKSYANAVSGTNNVKYNHHISHNTSNTNVANELQTILGKLKAQNPRKQQQRLGKISFRRNSKTKQLKAVAWELYAPLHTQACPSLKRNTSILSLETNPVAVQALPTIFSWYGPNQRTYLNPS